jgi:hypothetical protein
VDNQDNSWNQLIPNAVPEVTAEQVPVIRIHQGEYELTAEDIIKKNRNKKYILIGSISFYQNGILLPVKERIVQVNGLLPVTVVAPLGVVEKIAEQVIFVFGGEHGQVFLFTKRSDGSFDTVIPAEALGGSLEELKDFEIRFLYRGREIHVPGEFDVTLSATGRDRVTADDFFMFKYIIWYFVLFLWPLIIFLYIIFKMIKKLYTGGQK